LPEHLRALAVILLFASAVFVLAKAPACAIATPPADFERRRNLWIALTLAVFLAHSFWVYIAMASLIMLLTLPREANKLALFFFLLFAVPPIKAEVPGLGVFRYLFSIDHLRLLALVVLLPAFLQLRKRPDIEPFGRLLPDKLIAAYIVVNFGLYLSASTATNALRYGALYPFLDAFLPYYVASRSLQNTKDFRDALMAFVFAALLLVPIAAFEATRHWLLYAALNDTLGVDYGYGQYLERDGGTLRAQGSTGHAIPLGYVMAVALGLMLYVRQLVPGAVMRSAAFLALLVGLIAPVSRGPWVGMAAIVLLYFATGPRAMSNLAKLGVAGAILTAGMLATPAGEKIIDYLPFVGTVESENVEYRQRLLEICIAVILDSPLFGAYDSFYSLDLEALRQGQGIVDIVNSYIGIGLASGLVGLGLFVGFFATITLGILRAMARIPDKSDENHVLGRALVSTLIGILIIIFTVSSISVIPVIYWCFAGLGVAFSRMVARGNAAPLGVRPAPMLQGRS